MFNSFFIPFTDILLEFLYHWILLSNTGKLSYKMICPTLVCFVFFSRFHYRRSPFLICIVRPDVDHTINGPSISSYHDLLYSFCHILDSRPGKQTTISPLVPIVNPRRLPNTSSIMFSSFHQSPPLIEYNFFFLHPVSSPRPRSNLGSIRTLFLSFFPGLAWTVSPMVTIRYANGTYPTCALIVVFR